MTMRPRARALAAALLLGLAGLLAPVVAEGVGNCSIYKSFVTGDSVSANDLNSLQTTIGVTNQTTACLDDYSANATQMQSTTDPYVSSAEVLATSLQGEITGLRHVIKQLTGWTYWYTHTDDFNKTTTWNTAARNFCGLCQTITDTNSHASSRLMEFKRDGTIRAQMDKSGNLTYYGGATPANGQLFIGNATTGTWQAATLSAGTNITITNAAGAITVASTAGTPVTATVRTTAAFTTTSTSFVDVTDLTLTMTTGANRVLLLVTMVASQSAAGSQGNFRFDIDGTGTGDATNGTANKRFDTAPYTDTITMQYLTNALTAASHTFKVQARANANTLTIEGDSWDITFSAVEIL